jgi:hypothetical protein
VKAINEAWAAVNLATKKRSKPLFLASHNGTASQGRQSAREAI